MEVGVNIPFLRKKNLKFFSVSEWNEGRTEPGLGVNRTSSLNWYLSRTTSFAAPPLLAACMVSLLSSCHSYGQNCQINAFPSFPKAKLFAKGQVVLDCCEWSQAAKSQSASSRKLKNEEMSMKAQLCWLPGTPEPAGDVSKAHIGPSTLSRASPFPGTGPVTRSGSNCCLSAPRISVIDLQPFVHASLRGWHHASVGIVCDSG